MTSEQKVPVDNICTRLQEKRLSQGVPGEQQGRRCVAEVVHAVGGGETGRR